MKHRYGKTELGIDFVEFGDRGGTARFYLTEAAIYKLGFFLEACNAPMTGEVTIRESINAISAEEVS